MFYHLWTMFKPTGTLLAHHLVPDMERLTCTFKNRMVIFGNGDDNIAPYLSGYCGAHTSQHNGVQQLGSPAHYQILALLMTGLHSATAICTDMGPSGKGSGLKWRVSSSWYVYHAVLAKLYSIFLQTIGQCINWISVTLQEHLWLVICLLCRPLLLSALILRHLHLRGPQNHLVPMQKYFYSTLQMAMVWASMSGLAL